MKLGFDPSKSVFVEAVRAFHFMSHKTWEHKTEVYGRFGLSEDEIWSMFRKRPNCLSLSEKKITGVMNFLVCKMGWQAVLLPEFQAFFVLAWRRGLCLDVQLGLGISQSSISYLVIQSPSVMCQKVRKFAEVVKKVMNLGFDPSKSVFVEAVRAFHFMSHKTWEHKTEVYGRFGLSEDEIWSMFRKRPNCMSLSEKKVTGVMNFLVCKMGWQAAVVARVPSILCLSLERDYA
ncbi:hypothetical protein GH714_005909 [Hevea brasiliensis]|uniref:Uncharacterized protein n=1 Tax=Hevea brasiliensis TaxID=3981 RepID=A0A6A6NB01_HEVBR|nr:hypothetical protein GH714_005909 [Hevea brasiliensis]